MWGALSDEKNLCHKSILKPMYKNEWRITETNYVPITSVICCMKTEHARLKHLKPMKKYIKS
jgi:hypothetical protein